MDSISHTSKGFFTEYGSITTTTPSQYFFFFFTRAAKDWSAGKLRKALELGSAKDAGRRVRKEQWERHSVQSLRCSPQDAVLQSGQDILGAANTNVRSMQGTMGAYIQGVVPVQGMTKPLLLRNI